MEALAVSWDWAGISFQTSDLHLPFIHAVEVLLGQACVFPLCTQLRDPSKASGRAEQADRQRTSLTLVYREEPGEIQLSLKKLNTKCRPSGFIVSVWWQWKSLSLITQLLPWKKQERDIICIGWALTTAKTFPELRAAGCFSTYVFQTHLLLQLLGLCHTVFISCGNFRPVDKM